MNFWDTSALVALVADERQGPVARRVIEDDERMAVWWGTSAEYEAAIARRERDGSLKSGEAGDLLAWFDALSHHWYEVQPERRIKRLARRLLRVHALQAAQALQLAAALAVAEDDPSKVGFVCFDAALNQAASLEGLVIRTGAAGTS